MAKVMMALATGFFALSMSDSAPAQSGPIDLSVLPIVATVDERFQSYNVEMVEITGGRFWAPYGGPPGERYRMRPPIDLASPRLRQLARHLGPAYMRVSGTWANSTYLPAEGEEIDAPPEGFEQLLTRDQWRGTVDFANAVDARIVTSFPVSMGARRSDGSWDTEQPQRLLDLTREAGGAIAAAEYANEPNATALGRFPTGYSAQDYARDFRIFHNWARANAPEMTILGPGSVGEGAIFGSIPVAAQSAFIASADMLAANPDSVDAFSYHYYGAVSQRCTGLGVDVAQLEDALTPQWLDRTLTDFDFYAALRDTHEPGKPIWLTETAQAACGGSPWAASFVDSFRYLNQLGVLAQRGVRVVMHNTLAASDYALIDEDTLEPRSNYWAALLWRRTMGPEVLAPPTPPAEDVRFYTHCLPQRGGGVGMVVLNIGDQAREVALRETASIHVLTAETLDSEQLRVNEVPPAIGEEGEIEGLSGIEADALALPPYSIAFVAVAAADNDNCR